MVCNYIHNDSVWIMLWIERSILIFFVFFKGLIKFRKLSSVFHSFFIFCMLTYMEKMKLNNWIEIPKLASRISGGELEASRPFVCTKCGRSYLNNSNLQRHVLGCSDSSFPNSFHVCPLCSFSGSSKWQVKRHIQQVHKIIPIS